MSATTEFFFKYQGLGNDFIVLDRRESGRDIDVETSRWLCDRRLGVGADGVLALLPSTEALARMVVHNADGSVGDVGENGSASLKREYGVEARWFSSVTESVDDIMLRRSDCESCLPYTGRPPSERSPIRRLRRTSTKARMPMAMSRTAPPAAAPTITPS